MDLPPLQVQVSGGLPGRWGPPALQAAAAAALTAWIAQWLQLPVAAVAVLTTLGGLMPLAWATRRSPPAPVKLVFDGQRWSVDGQWMDLQVVWDLGDFLLLKASSPVATEAPRAWPQAVRTRWIPVAARETGPDRQAWRAAVYCRRPERATPGSGLPVA